MTGPGDDFLLLVARRGNLFRCLAEAQHTKPEIVEQLDVSRSTVDRSIRDLEGAGLVERGADGFELTLPGRVLLDAFERYREQAEGVAAATEVVSALPPDADLEPVVLAGVEVVMPDRSAPSRPIDRHVEYLDRADHVRTINTAVSPAYVEAYHRNVVEGDLSVELASTASAVRHLLTDYREALAEVLETGRAEVRELDEAPPFSLALADVDDKTVLNLLVYDEDGIRGLLINDSAAAVEWGEKQFARHWTQATPYDLPPSNG